MSSKSPALARICDAAMLHFSIHGYDGGSLSTIAGMVGIKKASLYSHFDGKDALYLQVLKDAIEVESTFAEEQMAKPVTNGGAGAHYVTAIGERYETSVHLRYLLRTVFLPPTALKDTIGISYEGFLEVLRNGFLQQMQTGTPKTLPENEQTIYARAYLGIVESLFVELIYVGREQMETRCTALWRLMADSLQLRHGPE